MKVLVTGITGFVGSHLAELLRARGESVVGVSRRGVWPKSIAQLTNEVPLEAADVEDAQRLAEVFGRHQPEHVYHLAGQANVPASLRDPAATWRANVEGSRALFEAVLASVPSAKVLHVSTGIVYGQPPPEEMPITERARLRPENPYALSKATADLIAHYYTAARQARIVVARPFNHIGPRQDPSFAIAHFAQQIAQVEAGLHPPRITVGELRNLRDFTDVRDVARAYVELMHAARPGAIYNVASETVRSVGELLDMLIRLSGQAIEVAQDPALLRRNDPPMLRVSIEALKEATGWRAEIPIEKTLQDTLDYWRATVR
jgi:GDP-4-dehydro-6-deoxy-D-mannose reductase